MKTIEEIAQYVIDNRYPKSENDKVSDFEMYQTLIEAMNKVLRQPLVMESVCSCSKGKGTDHDEDGKAYCIECGNYLEQTVP